MQAFRGDVFAASLFTAYVLFEPVFTGIVPAFESFITCGEACPDPFRDKTAFVHTDEILKLMSLLTDDDRYELTLNSEGGKPNNMCEMLDRVEARGVEKGRAEGMAKGRAEGMAKGEDMIIALLKKLTPGSEDYYKALNASSEERRELYKKYGIA